jgi:hypothetical protein
MAEVFEIDLAALGLALQNPSDFGSHGLHGCVPEVSIGSKILAAIRAGDLRVVAGVVGPCKLGSTRFAAKRY